MRIRIIKSGLAQSVERPFNKTRGRRFKSHCCVFLLHFLHFSFIIVILNYCKVTYKVFIIRNNKLIYLLRMISCLWEWSYYHYSLAKRPISRTYSLLPWHSNNNKSRYSVIAHTKEPSLTECIIYLTSTPNDPSITKRSHMQIRYNAVRNFFLKWFQYEI